MILYTPPNSDFTIIPNKILRNPNLSAQARLIAIYIISLPKNWNVNLAHIAKEVGIAERSIGKYIKELITAGILEKIQLKNDDGTFSKDTIYSFGNYQESKDSDAESNQEILDFENMPLEALESYIEKESKATQAPKNADSNRSANLPQTDNLHPLRINNISRKNNIYLLRTPNQIKLLNLCLSGGKSLKKQERQDLSPQGLNEAEQKAFSEFIAYRNEKKRITQSTHNAIVKKFEALKAQGVDIVKAVENSILNGWQGIFAPKQSAQFAQNQCGAQNWQKGFNTQKPKTDWLALYREKTGKELGVKA